MDTSKYLVAVVGAGPAGLYASRKLVEGGARVFLFNRDIKPGGLAEYGIYPDKMKMKQGLRNQFKQILALPQVEYFGNVSVCGEGNFVIDDLLEAGFQAVLITTGAQGTKWLHLPGEKLPGVYHAKNVVFHYNQLPPFSEKKYIIGKKVAIVGGGNVMMDIAHYLIRDRKVDEVIAVIRRGPGEIKFTRKEMETVGANLDLEALDAEFSRVAGIMHDVNQDPAPVKASFVDIKEKSLPKISETKFRFEFLSSPTEIIGDWLNGVTGLRVEDTTLLLTDGNLKAQGLGTTRIIDVETIIFAIGDTVDKDFCIPVNKNAYMTVDTPPLPCWWHFL